MAQPNGLDLVPIERSLDIGLGERPNPEWPHLAGPIDDPGPRLRPRHPGPGMGVLLSEALV